MATDPDGAAKRRERTKERAGRVSSLLGYPPARSSPASVYDIGGPSAQIRTAQREVQLLEQAEASTALLADILAELQEVNRLLRERTSAPS